MLFLCVFLHEIVKRANLESRVSIKIVFLDHIYLQVIKIDILHESVPGKTCPRMSLKVTDRCIEPDRDCEIKLHTSLFQRPKHLVGSGVVGGILNYGILDEMIIPPLYHISKSVEYIVRM